MVTSRQQATIKPYKFGIYHTVLVAKTTPCG